MAVASCGGVIVTDVNGVAYCEDMTGAPLAWEAVPEFDITELDPAIASAAFAAGFVIVGTAWAIGFGFRAILSMIRR